jgi:hypothetical protein
MLSPQGVRHSKDEFGFENDQAWTELKIPALFMTGTRDTTKFTLAEGRTVGFSHSPVGNKYLAITDGAAHMTFSGKGNDSLVGSSDSDESQGASSMRRMMLRRIQKTMPEESGERSRMLNDICDVTTTFLNAYLKNDPREKTRLNCKANAFDKLVNLQTR